jgi:hypothetical protein
VHEPLLGSWSLTHPAKVSAALALNKTVTPIHIERLYFQEERR